MAFVPVMLAIGAAVSAAGAYEQGQQQKRTLNYEAATAKNQANNAADVAGSNAIANQRTQRMQMGNAAAALAQSGTGFDGTGLMGLRQSGINAEMNTENIQYGGQQANIAGMNQAALDTSGAGYAGQNAYMSAAGQLFSGAGSIYRYQNNPSIVNPNGG